MRDYATARADGHILLSIARDALDMQEVDAEGMDKQDRRYLETLIQVFRGGPSGAEALAATMNVAIDTLTDEVEPYLLRRHFIVRTPRGRRATPRPIATSGCRNRSPKLLTCSRSTISAGSLIDSTGEAGRPNRVFQRVEARPTLQSTLDRSIRWWAVPTLQEAVRPGLRGALDAITNRQPAWFVRGAER